MNKHKPLRMCIVCRNMISKDELYRFVKNGEDIIPDTDNKIQGRGAYICTSDECLKNARKRKCLERHLKGNASIALDWVEEQINQ